MLNRVSQFIQSLFNVSRTESNAFLILIPLMVAVLFSETLYRQWWFSRPHDTTADVARLDSLLRSWPAPDRAEESKRLQSPFNPNHVPVDFLMASGLRKDIAQRVEAYRNKGGVFRKKTDVLRIYGMDSAWYAQAAKFMLLPDTLPRKVPTPRPSSSRPRAPAPVPVHINEADSLTLLAVRGIGPVFANRILRFRRALGGFVSMDQLLEVYNIDTAVVRSMATRFFVDSAFVPLRLSINRADERTLSNHPYLSASQARAIVAYRFQHGPFQSLDQLREIHLLRTLRWERVLPYLEL